MFILVPAYLGSPGSKAVKRLCVCVCVSYPIVPKPNSVTSSQSHKIPDPILPHTSVLKAHKNLQHQHKLPPYANYTTSNDLEPELLNLLLINTLHVLFK